MDWENWSGKWRWEKVRDFNKLHTLRSFLMEDESECPFAIFFLF